MKIVTSLFLFTLFTAFGYSQINFSGNWQGVIIRAGQKIDEGTLLQLQIDNSSGTLNGISREEIRDKDSYAIKKISSQSEGNNLTFEQIVIQKSTKSSRIKWCRLKANLFYNEKTGYLEGKYESVDCRRNIGQIILFKSNMEIEQTESSERGQYWFEEFLYSQKEGLNAPEIRLKERKNFIFEPVFFDFDKSDIRSEHNDFLNRMIKVVKGHSDLRVMVIGHTDSDGTDSYNIELSKRRAKAIVDYFVANGLNKDRLSFDFKGEMAPIDTNSTSEGKQRNRRVDFQFI
ncbi:MAG: OmpA family protein [Crocinitomicaceae bacterium]|nr:OmpA family protein [Crocinitomicaceae bacterium]